MTPEPLVTVSASYGAGGSRVAPLLAEVLGVRYVERAMHRGIADLGYGRHGGSEPTAEPVGRLRRVLRGVAGGRSDVTVAEHEAEAVADDEFRRVSEEELLAVVETGGVVLGRAAAVVLRDVPHALHVRMSGPRELRITQAMEVEGIDRETACWRQATEDLARDAYVRHFYGVDPLDERLYHLTIDSARLPLDACVEAIAAAARKAS